MSDVDVNEHKRRGGRFDDKDAEVIELPKASTIESAQSPLPPTRAGGIRKSLRRMRLRAKGEEVPIPLPWPALAANLGGGLWPQTSTILVGSTGAGKTQLAIQAALHAAKRGVPVVYVALELDALGMDARLMALHLRDVEPKRAPKWSELCLGEVAEDVLAWAEQEAAHIEALPFHLEEGPTTGWNYRDLERLASQMSEKYDGRPFLVVLDFLQLVDGEGWDDRDVRLRVKGAANFAREVARRINGAAVLTLSGTAREHYGTLDGDGSKGKMQLGEGNPARLLGTAKEAGDVEYAADCQLVLAREPWRGDAPSPDGTHIWIALAKVRAKSNQATAGWVELRFDGSYFKEPEATANSTPKRPPRAGRREMPPLVDG